MIMDATSKIRSEELDRLFEAILSMESLDECYRFFEDLATVPEIKSLAQRLQVAKMLMQNETYTLISKTTGASTATISRVKNALFYGEDGYKLLSIRIPLELYERLDQIAEEANTSRNEIINILLEEGAKAVIIKD